MLQLLILDLHVFIENDVILITTYYLLWNDWKFLYHKPFLKNYGKKIKEEKPYLKNNFFFDTFLFWGGEIWSWMSMLKISKSVYQLSLLSLLLRIIKLTIFIIIIIVIYLFIFCMHCEGPNILGKNIVLVTVLFS